MSEAVAAGPVVHSPSHPLHAGARLWPETNCYADVWIELLHWAELDPVASFFYALGMDWEGDQFTFFKPPHEDLRTLYGIEVQELALWKPLEVHVEEQCALGRVVLVEADSFWLPDTAGTTYREGRTKSTIGAWRIHRPSRAATASTRKPSSLSARTTPCRAASSEDGRIRDDCLRPLTGCSVSPGPRPLSAQMRAKTYVLPQPMHGYGSR